MDSWIVSYDISDPKRLRKVARACEDYGVRKQLSVFLCRLSATDFVKLRCRLYDLGSGILWPYLARNGRAKSSKCTTTASVEGSAGEGRSAREQGLLSADLVFQCKFALGWHRKHMRGQRSHRSS